MTSRHLQIYWRFACGWIIVIVIDLLIVGINSKNNDNKLIANIKDRDEDSLITVLGVLC